MAESRRRWLDSETKCLVDLVQVHYDFLFQALSNTKTRMMVNSKWKEITDIINSLGVGDEALTVDKIQKKWADLRSSSKKAIQSYKKDCLRTGGGKKTVKEPTELQKRIGSIIGSIYTEGIPKTDGCESESLPTVTIQNSDDGLSFLERIPNVEFSSPIQTSLSPNRPPKRPRMSKREIQNEELMKAEKSMCQAVNDMKEELKKTNDLISEVVVEMRRSNNIQQQLLEVQLMQMNPTRTYTSLMYPNGPK